jgi:hypothetical protein
MKSAGDDALTGARKRDTVPWRNICTTKYVTNLISSVLDVEIIAQGREITKAAAPIQTPGMRMCTENFVSPNGETGDDKSRLSDALIGHPVWVTVPGIAFELEPIIS